MRIIAACLVLFTVASAGFAQAVIDTAFWNTVVPAWKRTRAELSNVQLNMQTWKLSAIDSDPKPGNPTIMKISFRNGMEKVEWFKFDKLAFAFANDGNRTFTVGPTGGNGDGLMVQRVGDAATLFTADPLVKFTTCVLAAISIHPGYRLDQIDVHKTYFRILECDIDGKTSGRVAIGVDNQDERITLELDGSRNWAISRWEQVQSGRRAWGRNTFADQTPFGKCVPTELRYCVVTKGDKIEEARLVRFDQPRSCDLPPESFRVSSYGLPEPTLPVNSGRSQELTNQAARQFSIGKLVLATVGILFAIGCVFWIRSRSSHYDGPSKA